MQAEETSLIAESARAEDNKDQIIQAKMNLAANYLVLARLLNENHRDSLFKLVGCDSFEEFLGTPEIGIKKSTGYNLIKVWRLFKEKLSIDDHTLLDIGHTKLLKIAPVVEQDKDEWLGKAKSLSVSDLVCEIQGVPGGRNKPFSPPPVSPASPPSPRMTPKQYEALVESSPCLNCGATEGVVKAHFPRTRVRAEKEWHIVPLCGKCHAEQEGSSDWCWKYRGNWARWFYNLIAGE